MKLKEDASLGRKFRLLIGLNCFCLAALGGAFLYQGSAQSDAQSAYKSQYQSYLLADEFRQSSDDLTRLVRTYAATADSKYEKWYFDVIKMRNGEAARPQEPNRIYWDLVVEDGDAPRPAGEKKALLDSMVEAGFTPAELNLLEEAKKRSDTLVQLEVRAMDAVKGNGTANGQADLALAQDLLYSKEYHRAKASVMEPVDEFFGAIGSRTAAQSEAAQAAVARANLVMLLIGLLLVASIGATAVILQRRVMTPIAKLRDCMSALAGGDLAAEVPMADRNDEVGAMANTLLVFKNAVSGMQSADEAEQQRLQIESERAQRDAEKEREAEEDHTTISNLGAGLAALATGDLSYRIEAEFSAKTRRLKDDFNAAMAKLQETMAQVLASTGAINTGSSELTQAADDLSMRTEQQAASLEETAATLEEITATVKKTAEGALHANEVVQAASANAEKSGDVVSRAVSAMGEIERSAQEISQIIGVIDEIAFQTNLLALNAGVEAARAGDAGKGFAVVASEVRALAQRSAEAAKEIKALISTSTTQVGQGVHLVGETGNALQAIASQVTEISSIMASIAASAQEQSSGLTQVNVAVNQMDSVTQQNAAMVEESTAASHSLLNEAQNLNTLVGQFKIRSGSDHPIQSGGSRNPVHQLQVGVKTGLKVRSSKPSAPARPFVAGNNALKADATVDEASWQEF